MHELSKALPASMRPLPAHLVEVADNNTAALPNTGMDAGQHLHPGRQGKKRNYNMTSLQLGDLMHI